MLDPSTLTVFVAAALALLLTPGPAVLYIVARSIDQGRLAGFVSILGLGTGTLVHVAAAAFGLSALLMSSVHAFTVLKYAGAAYLVYLGARKLLERDGAARDASRISPLGRGELSKIYGQGFWVSVLNPKSAFFFFAFLPQFIDVSRGSVQAQALFLGLVFVVLALLCDSAWALFAGTLGDALRHHPGFARAQRYVSGGVLIALGAVAATSGSKS